MSDPFQNLQEKTGRSMDAWFGLLETAGLEKHGEIMNWLKSEHGVSHGFANGIALQFRSRGADTGPDALIDAQYSGAKAALRPILARILEVIATFGDDVEVAPKKTSVSLRRSKQFAVVEAASASRMQIGIQLRDFPSSDRLLAWGGMCSHKVFVSSPADIDDELIQWLREAYDRN